MPETSPSSEALHTQLAHLPGVEAVLWSGGDLGQGAEGSLSPGEIESTRSWLRILSATSTRMCEELDHGAPRLLTLSCDDRLIALACDPVGAFVAVIASDSSVMGLAVAKLRSWIQTRREGDNS
ncbi:hypothetical protein G6O69_02530 [Pseudenhygromyxa sp. WMMC2535]|uniref:hypothetical protein n=1 Tax=Pseudenhygromyxa sp. WMMC2535 TaxID=2712867 RepID=UPI001551F8EE|nr:hypothetical protein [Pseudenhygromyxa sp. WMMC2535]NVB36691.1 hypothetical protein [Pseudenhygromyxa sp. WMMC2535]